MSMQADAAWPDRRALDLLGIAVPILQAPMAGSNDAALAIAVAQAGGLGAIPCAALDPERIRAEVARFRAAAAAPLNLNFFAHAPPRADAEALARWRKRLARYYAELGVDAGDAGGGGRAPFDATLCALVEELRPEVVSFHFGLPGPALLARVRRSGAKVLASATTVAEARWLAERGCDAVVAQGAEAGGHRGCFLDLDVATQPGLFALLPQVADAVAVPVIAAGGIADARGIAAAFALGAAGVQIGTAYLRTPEATTAPLHRAALREARDDATALTNLFTGRPARGLLNRLMRELGPMGEDVPPFPLAAAALAPLRARAGAAGAADFQPLWAGQAAALAQERPAGVLTREWAAQALHWLARGPGRA